MLLVILSVDSLALDSMIWEGNQSRSISSSDIRFFAE